MDIKEDARILIVKLSAIGDVVLATPVAKALRKAYPKAYLAWVVEEKAKDVLIGNPYLDEVIIAERHAKRVLSFLKGLYKVTPEIRARKFDVAIDLQGLLRSALVCRASGAPCRLGYGNSKEGAVAFYNLKCPSSTHVRGPQQYLNLLTPMGITTHDTEMHVPMQEEDREFARRFLEEEGLFGIAAMCPATTWRQKHWTEEGWARLADRLSADYGISPVFMGSSVDLPLINRIRGLMSGKSTVAAGRTTLRQAAAILEMSDPVFTVDTGLLHIAQALNRRCVGIFGPTGWAHYGEKSNLAIAAKNLPCMPCMRHPSCKQFDCMATLTAEDVISAAGHWLSPRTAAVRGVDIE